MKDLFGIIVVFTSVLIGLASILLWEVLPYTGETIFFCAVMLMVGALINEFISE